MSIENNVRLTSFQNSVSDNDNSVKEKASALKGDTTQIQKAIEKACSISAARIAVTPLGESLKTLLESLERSGNSAASKDLFHALPLNVKNELYYFVWVALGVPKEDNFGQKTLRDNPLSLLQITAPWIFPHGKSLLEQYIKLDQEKSDLQNGTATLELHRYHQYESFKALYNHSEVNHRQLKQVYNNLHPEVKKDQPVPPYYGHGVRADLYRKMGAHPNKDGTEFRVFAPGAKKVSVAIIDKKESWKNASVLPMKRTQDGIWEVQGNKIESGSAYEYIIEAADGKILKKADPFAFGNRESHHYGFHHESIVTDLGKFVWKDESWIKNRTEAKPVNMLEVHLETWRKKEGRSLNYRELAQELVKYCADMGFTHVELMGILDHPNQGSMGYQVSGYFSPNFRLGTPEDFQYFVDFLHQNKIGVVIDWIPAHFAIDEYGLKKFDGTHLYEHPDVLHPTWKTHCFNYTKTEVRNLLLSSALFWLDKMHIDGLRVDAVDPMRRQKAAKLFLRDLNATAHRQFPGVLIIAEDTGGTPGLTHPLTKKGIGFDAKWHVGFLHHILKYMQLQVEDRPAHHQELIDSLNCDPDQRTLIPFSHDLVPLTDIMPGDDWKKKANARLLSTLALCLPGMKLNFDKHFSNPETEKCVKVANHLFIKTAAFWESEGITMLDQMDSQNSVISYLRKDKHGNSFACVHNFSAKYCEEYIIKSPHIENFSYVQEIFNSDNSEFGGSGKINRDPILVKPDAIKIQLPPLATAIFKF